MSTAAPVIAPKPERPRTPFAALIALTVLGSIGTGLLWGGIPFVAKHDYRFTANAVLFLFLIAGIIYTLAALASGPLLRGIRRWMMPRTFLAFVFVLQTLASFTPIISRSVWTLWVVAIIYSATAALLWPVVESYLTAGRHGREMRRAIGWWNVWWTGAVAASLWLIAPIMGDNARIAIVALAALNILAIGVLHWFRREPAAHIIDAAHPHVGAEYPLLLRSARVLLPTGYVLAAALGPLLPFLLGRLDVKIAWETPAAATWMMVRVVTVAVMWQVPNWHGRWGTLIFGGVCLAIGFTAAVLAQTIAIMLTGLALFGVGMAVIYYAALYYAMSVGHAEVEAGGAHEAFIGLGYAIGPVAAFAAFGLHRILSGDPRADAAPQYETLLVVITLAIMLLAGLLAFRPYLAARRLRRNPNPSLDSAHPNV